MTSKDYFQQKDKNLGDLYEEEAGPQHKYYVEVKTRHMVRLCRKLCGNLKKLDCLSIGCGTGEAEAHYADSFRSVLGIDYSKGMIEKAKKLGLKNAQFKTMDATQLGLKSSSFDVVVIFNVLHHVSSKKGLIDILKESERVLKNKGLLLVYEMNPYNPVTKHIIRTLSIDKDVTLNGFSRNKFPSTLSPKQLSILAGNAGLAKVSDYFLIFFPKCIGFLSGFEFLLGKIPFGGLYSSVFRKS